MTPQAIHNLLIDRIFEQSERELAQIHGWPAITHDASCDLRAALIDGSPAPLGELEQVKAELVAACDELHHVSNYLWSEIEEMTCEAGNFDGGSTANCEHCQAIAWANRIDALLDRR